MFAHGIHKLIDGHEGIRSMLAKANLPEFLWLGVPVGEVLAPLCLILGVFTRSAALLISFTMIMAIYLTQGLSGLMLNQTYGSFNAELNLWHLLVGVSIFFLGSGKYALSEAIFTKKLKLKNY